MALSANKQKPINNNAASTAEACTTPGRKGNENCHQIIVLELAHVDYKSTDLWKRSHHDDSAARILKERHHR